MPIRTHPILKHVLVLASAALVIGTVAISWFANAHSAAWLVALYTTLGLILAVARSLRGQRLFRPYILYLINLASYLAALWILHVAVPGDQPAQTRRFVELAMVVLCPGVILNAIAHYHFALRFAEIKSRIPYWIEYGGWAISGYFVILNFTGNFATNFQWYTYTWAPDLTGPYKQFFYLTTFFLTLGISVPIIKLVRTTDHRQRLRLLFYVLGAFPLWGACWLNFLLSLGVRVYPAGGLAFILHAGLMAYAVWRHRVFDVSVVIRRGLVYAGISAAMGLVYGAITWTSQHTVQQDPQLVGAVLFIMAAGLIFAPLLNSLQTVVDRFFFREEYDRQQQLSVLVRESAATINLRKLVEAVCHFYTSSLRAQSVSVYLTDPAGKPRLFGEHAGTFHPAPWPLSETCPHVVIENPPSRAPLRVSVARNVDQSSRIALSAGEESLLVPVFHQNACLGYILLGPKLSDEEYDDADLRFAALAADHLAIAVSNARAFANMQQLQDAMRQVFEAQTVGTLLLTSYGAVLNANEAAVRLLWGKETPPEAWSVHDARTQLAERVATLPASNGITNVEFCADDTRLLISSRNFVYVDGQSVCLVILSDITEYERVKALARRREQLAQVGGMIASINHELSNITHPISSQAQRLVAIQSEHPIIADIAKVMTDKAASLERLLANLRSYSRPIELNRRTAEVEKLIDITQREIKEVFRDRQLDITKHISVSASHCVCDVQWFRQVLFNLIKNAVEASPESRGVRISVRAEQVNGKFTLSISDEGAGMDERTRERLFEPFFSTKGQFGTGLGLSICKKIIELHDGTILVRSERGAGTTFTITLPAQAVAATPAALAS